MGRLIANTEHYRKAPQGWRDVEKGSSAGQSAARLGGVTPTEFDAPLEGTERQRQGIWQTLLAHALAALRSESVEVVITYSDSNYYRQVGAMPITEDQAYAPLPLNCPHGWLGQSLTDQQMPALQSSTCVSALDRADVW